MTACRTNVVQYIGYCWLATQISTTHDYFAILVPSALYIETAVTVAFYNVLCCSTVQ